MQGYTEDQLVRATKAVHEVTGGGIPFGKPRRGKTPHRVFVSASLVAQAALDAATTKTITEPLNTEAEKVA
jgi:cyanate lyase